MEVRVYVPYFWPYELWGYYPSKIGHWLIWVNYNISPTWLKVIWGWFPFLTMIPVRSQWGRYNLPRLMFFCDFKIWFTPTFWIDWPQPRTGHRHLAMDGDMDGYGYQVRPFFVSKLHYQKNPHGKNWSIFWCKKWIHTKDGHRMSQNHRIWAFWGLNFWWRFMDMMCRWLIVIIEQSDSPSWLVTCSAHIALVHNQTVATKPYRTIELPRFTEKSPPHGQILRSFLHPMHPLIYHSHMLHGAGICTPTFTLKLTQSCKVNIPAPWSIWDCDQLGCRANFLQQTFPTLPQAASKTSGPWQKKCH